jgi:excisionase family DNA binding protein
MVDTIMTVKELALYLRLHESSIYRMCQAGKIPAYKVGRGWRFRKEEIDKWLAQQSDKRIENKDKPLGEDSNISKEAF